VIKKALNDIISTMKDIKSLLTFFSISGASVLSFSNEALNIFVDNLPFIFILSLFSMFIYINISNKAMEKRVLLVERNQRITALKYRVDSLYKSYGKSKIKDKWVVKGLEDLKNELTELSVNSYTQGKLEAMIANIDYDAIYDN
jgi:hypothetical protein